MEGVPQEFFFVLSFDGQIPQVTVTFRVGFKAEGGMEPWAVRSIRVTCGCRGYRKAAVSRLEWCIQSVKHARTASTSMDEPPPAFTIQDLTRDLRNLYPLHCIW